MKISLTDVPTDALNEALEYVFVHGYSVRIKNTCAIRWRNETPILVFDVTVEGENAREVFRSAWKLHLAATGSVFMTLPRTVCLPIEDDPDPERFNHVPPCCPGGLEG